MRWDSQTFFRVTRARLPSSHRRHRYKDFVDDDGAGFTRAGPFDASNWWAPQVLQVRAADDHRAEWSKGGARGGDAARFDDHCGDDVLAIFGVSATDDRYRHPSLYGVCGLLLSFFYILVSCWLLLGVEVVAAKFRRLRSPSCFLASSVLPSFLFFFLLLCQGTMASPETGT